MKHLSIVLLLVLPTVLFSQTIKTSDEINLEVGKPYPVVDASVKEYFYHEGELLSVKVHGDITIQKFSTSDLGQTSRLDISNKKELPRGFVHEEFVQKNDKVYQFYNVWDKPNKTEQIFVQEISFENPKLDNSTLITKRVGKMTSQAGRNKIDVYQSFDKKKHLLTYRVHPTEKRDKLNYDVIGMIILDENMQLVWKREIKMPYTEKEMDNLGYTVDNNGNPYLLARVRKDGNPRLEIMMFGEEETDPRITIIEADGKHFPHGIILKQGKENRIYCGGFYGEGNSATGVYISILSPDGDIENEVFHDIPLDIINQNTSVREQKKKEKAEDKGKEVGIYELGLNEININDDGSFVLIGEVFYIHEVTTYYKGQSRTTRYYNYKEMFITKIDGEGELVWMKKLAKYQQRVESSSGIMGFGIADIMKASGLIRRSNYDLSYKYLHNASGHYLLYLDNVKNLALTYDKVPAKHMSGKGGFFTAYKIDDASGDISKLSLFDMRDLKGTGVYQFSTDRIVLTKENVMLLELYKKQKEDLLIKITIDD